MTARNDVTFHGGTVDDAMALMTAMAAHIRGVALPSKTELDIAIEIAEDPARSAAVMIVMAEFASRVVTSSSAATWETVVAEFRESFRRRFQRIADARED